MDSERIFRAFFVIAAIAMIAIRVYYQSRVLHEEREINVREDPIGLAAGSLASLTAIVFGLEYIFSPGFFAFAYILDYPDWLRWFGVFMLAGGIALLGLSHHYLGKSFHSLVVSKENQTLVEQGPYRWIRHPIYTAYLLNYVGGGLLASNWVLTFVPVTLFGFMIYRRIPNEEQVMEDQFGHPYVEYKTRTGSLVPKIG